MPAYSFRHVSQKYAISMDFEQLLPLLRENVKEVWEDFNQVQTEVEEEKKINIEIENYRFEFEEIYFKNTAECDRMMKNVSLENSCSDSIEYHNSHCVGHVPQKVKNPWHTRSCV